jgi:hypothetical protein
MKTQLSTLALAATFAAGTFAVSVSSHAAVVAAAGDALLIPLVVWGNGNAASPGSRPESERDDVNTIIEITTPGVVGWEDVANIFTARHSTPTNANLKLTPQDPDLGDDWGDYNGRIRWYWFDKYSKDQESGTEIVSPDDVVQINWRYEAGGNWDDEPGYMLVVTDASANQFEANFAMFGEAFLVSGEPGFGATIPVLPLMDGADCDAQGLNCATKPTRENNVIFSRETPQVSPLIAGMRNSLTDGVATDLWVFDLMLSDREYPTIHVVWLDQAGDNSAKAYVFDTEEHWCDTRIDLPYEINVVLIPPVNCRPFECQGDGGGDGVCDDGQARGDYDFKWVDPLNDYQRQFGNRDQCLVIPHSTNWFNVIEPGLCVRGLDLEGYTRADGFEENVGGFVQYRLPEYDDDGSNNVTSSGMAFAIKYAEIPDDNVEDNFERYIWAEMSLGQDRGMFK